MVKAYKDNVDHFFGELLPSRSHNIRRRKDVRILPRVYVPNDPPGVGTLRVENMAHYEGLLLGVLFLEKYKCGVFGSAVMVAPGIAVTATHIFDDSLQLATGETRIVCAGLTSSGPRHWHVRYHHRVEQSDVTILGLEFASPFPADGQFVQAVLTNRLPAIGEHVMIAGLRAASNEKVQGDENMWFPVIDNRIQWAGDVLVAVGEVTAHHLTGRDGNLPGPTIEVACSTPGGLSGGPAFDREGKLIGVLAASFDDPDGRGPSQVSLLRTALAIEIQPFTRTERDFLTHTYPKIFRLLNRRECAIEYRHLIKVRRVKKTGMNKIWVRDKS
jgi:hypothetical protein